MINYFHYHVSVDKIGVVRIVYDSFFLLFHIFIFLQGDLTRLLTQDEINYLIYVFDQIDQNKGKINLIRNIFIDNEFRWLYDFGKFFGILYKWIDVA